MKIVTAAEMREIDRVTTAKHFIPSLMLMENAGSAVAQFALKQYPEAKEVLVVCGIGNNGGDGCVAARKLHEAGRQVTVLLLGLRDDVRGDALKMMQLLPFAPVVLPSSQKVISIRPRFESADLIVDAIFGTGFRAPMPEVAAKAIDFMGRSEAPIISVDIPSGADADSLDPNQPFACRSSAIVTFTAPKPAIVFGPLTRGPIVVAAIGSSPDTIVSNLGMEWNRPPSLLTEQRNLNSNKGLYGHALVVGGSRGKSGAPAMAALAALRAGAGLVTCAIPASILPVVAATAPELMTEPLAEDSAGALSDRAFEATKQLLHRKNVVAVGPGLGRAPGTVSSIRKFVAECPLPLVLDADGLNAFEQEDRSLEGNTRPLVLTPHTGEMARLTGRSIPEIETNRIVAARTFAREHRVILVLKGWRTVIANPDGQVWINTTGNPGLAKGGSGDVLTGIIAGMIAQHPDRIVDAVRAAVYVHGLAADFALHRQTERTMLATDVIGALPNVFRSVEYRGDFTWLQGIAQRA